MVDKYGWPDREGCARGYRILYDGSGSGRLLVAGSCEFAKNLAGSEPLEIQMQWLRNINPWLANILDLSGYIYPFAMKGAYLWLLSVDEPSQWYHTESAINSGIASWFIGFFSPLLALNSNRRTRASKCASVLIATMCPLAIGAYISGR